MNSMPPPLDPETASSVIHLPSHATTVTAEDLLARLINAADDGATTIDASASESIGQAALQVLLAARIEAAEVDLLLAAGAHVRRRVPEAVALPIGGGLASRLITWDREGFGAFRNLGLGLVDIDRSGRLLCTARLELLE